MEQLERTADGGNANKSSPAEKASRDRNLSGVVNATSKALKAALMENEELSARNAELEAKLATGGSEDTDAKEIERALTAASAALAARRQDILALEHQVATLQAENSVMIESQMRLQGAVSSHLAVEVSKIH
jgi:aminopeptidase N